MSQYIESIAINPRSPSLAARAVVYFLAFLASPAAMTQSLDRLDRLVFEPTPLETGPVTADVHSQGTPYPSPEPRTESQATSDPEAEITQYRDAIRTEEQVEGPYSPELLEDLLTLGKLHQQQGTHERAIELFKRAEHLVRVNKGLYAIEQVESIEAMLESLIATGNIQEADDKYRYLVYLHKRHYGADDIRVIPSLQTLAEWNMRAFHRIVRHEATGGVSLTFGRPSSTEKDFRRQAFGRLYRAQSNYLQAIQNLLDNEAYTDPRLIPLERRLIETYFLQSHRKNLVYDPHNYLNTRNTATGSLLRKGIGRGYSQTYQFGNEAYSRILVYLVNDPEATVEEYVQYLMELADWYLLYSRRRLAFDKYQKAYEILDSVDVPPAAIETQLNNMVPRILPSFSPVPHTREIYQIPPEQVIDYDGHIDLSFTLSKYGKARGIDTLDKSPGTSRDVERRLINFVRGSQFRPQVQENGPVEKEFTLRFHYAFMENPPFYGGFELPELMSFRREAPNESP